LGAEEREEAVVGEGVAGELEEAGEGHQLP
jgi:hypothetical protein